MGERDRGREGGWEEGGREEGRVMVDMKIRVKWVIWTCAVSKYIGECGNTLYVGLAHAVPPTNTKFKPLLLPTQAGMPYTNTHKHRTSYFKSTLTFLGPAKR